MPDPQGASPDPGGARAIGRSSFGVLPTVAIVGRPNVGKSSLFNRMARERIAIVADEPGTTRDRVTALVTRDERALILVDTGGLVLDHDRGMNRAVREQVLTAVAEADLLLFVLDVTAGTVPADEEVAALLRTSGKPVLLVANKADSPKRESLAVEFHRLGLGEPLPVSAHHNLGMDDLWDRILALLPAPPEEAAAPEEGTMSVAIIGRPNVGKSSLVNAILGERRVVVDETPGTTRDAVDTPFTYKDRRYVLIDTAGLRRRGHIETGVETFSAMRAMQAIERADVAVLVLDAADLLAAQDLHVAGYVQKAFKGLVLVINKWDLVEAKIVDRGGLEATVRERLKFFPDVPLLFTSALEGTGVLEVLEAVARVYTERLKRVTTGQINRMLLNAVGAHPPPSAGHRRLQIYYGTQAEVNPPTFVFFANYPALIHFSYRRYLENAIRRNFGFQGTAIRLVFKGRDEARAMEAPGRGRAPRKKAS